MFIAPFGDAYEKIGTIQRRLAWPLHKDDTLFQSGRPTGLNIYFIPFFHFISAILTGHLSTIFKEEDGAGKFLKFVVKISSFGTKHNP